MKVQFRALKAKELEHTMTRKTRRGHIVIDRDLCKGCCLCMSVCPHHMIKISDTLNEKGYYPAEFTGAVTESDDSRCTGCATCALICPDVAIEVYRE